VDGERQLGWVLAPPEGVGEAVARGGLHQLGPLVEVGGEEVEARVGQIEALLADPALAHDQHLVARGQRGDGDGPLLQCVLRHVPNPSAGRSPGRGDGRPW
jgi:hypothetical protein